MLPLSYPEEVPYCQILEDIHAQYLDYQEEMQGKCENEETDEVDHLMHQFHVFFADSHTPPFCMYQKQMQKLSLHFQWPLMLSLSCPEEVPYCQILEDIHAQYHDCHEEMQGKCENEEADEVKHPRQVFFSDSQTPPFCMYQKQAQ
jgi:hypothetical protein